jgi:hypothetical protein
VIAVASSIGPAEPSAPGRSALPDRTKTDSKVTSPLVAAIAAEQQSGGVAAPTATVVAGAQAATSAGSQAAVRGICGAGEPRRAVATRPAGCREHVAGESARTVLLRRRCECGADHDRDRSSTRAHLRRAPELSRTAQTASRTSGRRSRRPSGRRSFPSGTLPISPWPGAHIAGDGRRGPWICFANEPLRWQVRYQSA